LPALFQTRCLVFVEFGLIVLGPFTGIVMSTFHTKSTYLSFGSFQNPF